MALAEKQRSIAGAGASRGSRFLVLRKSIRPPASRTRGAAVMTIAGRFLTPGGVVLGADSTTSMYVEHRAVVGLGQQHHYTHVQKIFEIGEGSTFGAVTGGWADRSL